MGQQNENARLKRKSMNKHDTGNTHREAIRNGGGNVGSGNVGAGSSTPPPAPKPAPAPQPTPPPKPTPAPAGNVGEGGNVGVGTT